MNDDTITYLGIDGGGTKTVCLLTAQDGTILGRGEAGPSNYQNVGQEAAQAALHAAIERAYQAAGLPLRPAAVACLGLAGVDRPTDRAVIEGIVTRLNLARRALIVNDAVIALASATQTGRGVVVIAGTGSIAFGINSRGQRRRAGGWGPLLGDEGSGYAIGAEALRRVVRAYDGIGVKTALTDAICAEWGLSNPQGLISVVYAIPTPRDRIAALGRVVFQVAEAGDPVARAILKQAGRGLGRTAGAVIRGLRMTDEAFELAAAGSIFKSGAIYLDAFWSTVTALAPKARLVFPEREPAWGAVRLAIGEVDVSPGEIGPA